MVTRFRGSSGSANVDPALTSPWAPVVTERTVTLAIALYAGDGGVPGNRRRLVLGDGGGFPTSGLVMQLGHTHQTTHGNPGFYSDCK